MMWESEGGERTHLRLTGAYTYTGKATSRTVRPSRLGGSARRVDRVTSYRDHSLQPRLKRTVSFYSFHLMGLRKCHSLGFIDLEVNQGRRMPLFLISVKNWNTGNW